MGSSVKKYVELLVIILSLGTTSCERKSPRPPEPPKKTDSEKQADSDGKSLSRKQIPEGLEKRPLSREQIIEAANAAARKQGWNLNEYRLFFDEDNASWKSRTSGIRVPELEGHDYQVIIYRLRQPKESGDHVVIIDRNTGEVLMVFALG